MPTPKIDNKKTRLKLRIVQTFEDERGACSMSDSSKLSRLTRSLLVGVSTGTVALTQVGCATLPQTVKYRMSGGGAEERQLCNRALETYASADVEAFIRAYPDSVCVAPLLNTTPLAALSAVSADALGSVPESTWNQVSAARRSALMKSGQTMAPAPAPSVPTLRRDRDY